MRIKISAQMTRTEARKFLIQLLNPSTEAELVEIDKWLELAKISIDARYMSTFGDAIGVYYSGPDRRYEIRLALHR